MTQGRWHGRQERRRGQRWHDAMSVIAQPLTGAEIDNLATWYLATPPSVQRP
ncbi:hypothetical protein JNX00_18350 [Hydrogenophaga sp. YM1]|uniref:hypothetical protein n=1 Tax=unclassified Hydrogenophaga TaxID=2610897 RepID=UPI0015862F02|nr:MULTISPECIES: hypothetical protein [unclassified Hydrogenophaga]QRR33580.1 hypothetical protein JNX00_18350 [Hydrogenophaga sp. YM1]